MTNIQKDRRRQYKKTKDNITQNKSVNTADKNKRQEQLDIYIYIYNTKDNTKVNNDAVGPNPQY
jgi:hypothetical protein